MGLIGTARATRFCRQTGLKAKRLHRLRKLLEITTRIRVWYVFVKQKGFGEKGDRLWT